MRPPRSIARVLRALWPHAPLAVLLIAAGAINVLTGSRAESLPGFASGALPDLDQQVSLALLGSGAQIVFGACLMLTGIGLFWRARVAWTFAVMLLLITIFVNVIKLNVGTALILPSLMLLALLWLQRYFDRPAPLGNSLISLIGVVAVVVYGTLGLYLLGDQFEPRIHSVIAAVYFLVETLTTTGYGDYHPVTPLAQGFIIALWVFGLSIFGTAIVSVAGPALSERLDRFFTPGGKQRMETDHVILVGGGLIARNTAGEFVRRGIGFVQVVETDEQPPLPDQPVVIGDTSDDVTLGKAGVANARLLIAAEDDDGENAFISLAAKALNPDLKVLVVASSRRAIRRLKLAQADLVFAPVEVGSRMLVNLVEGGRLPEEFADLAKHDDA